MFFASRSPRSADALTWWKAALLVIGAAVFLFGTTLEIRWVSWVGLALLLVTFVLRFVRPPSSPPDADGDVSR
jgi:membrane protein implicated in regulation of membrane protease activity